MSADRLKPVAFRELTRHLWKTKKHADFVIECEDHSIRCHKAIVCPQSTFFGSCLLPGFSEASSNAVILREVDPFAVELMIFFFYHFDYPFVYEGSNSAPWHLRNEANDDQDGSETFKYVVRLGDRHAMDWGKCKRKKYNGYPTRDVLCFHCPIALPCHLSSCPAPYAVNYKSANFLFHIKLYCLAEQYVIPELQSLAVRKFKQDCCFFYGGPEFVEAVREIYTSPKLNKENPFRHVVVHVLFRTLSIITDEISELMATTELSYDIRMWAHEKCWREEQQLLRIESLLPYERQAQEGDVFRDIAHIQSRLQSLMQYQQQWQRRRQQQQNQLTQPRQPPQS